ncbi:hypothetical protein SAMN04488132_102382 [Sediminibacterium ginsengisoli]|uniref:Uncharacterized protein n=1 Tax=Sediminibacterium ginsengisoli TaxID=413434 RepID=A0A1T4L9T7_9BACT|nr:hypothetical protein SAMN04488132_102382 [Sediminibacterium ginsengisoli]
MEVLIMIHGIILHRHKAAHAIYLNKLLCGYMHCG